VIDREGYRHNVGIILVNSQGQLFWARRIGENSWQFPQGGIRADETPEEALYRELAEEVGLRPEDVEVVGSTQNWLRYRLPKRFVHRRRKPVCIGQKQRWFLLKLISHEERVRLDASEKPEFDHWRWVDHEAPVNEVVSFKRGVYQRALDELIPLINTQQA
jgi:putative (di)nucleoside polyphosphate hydrolase